jgi:hypothetical protein
MWVNALGWTATAIFAVSYFSKSSRSLRLIQASAAALWIVYGLAIHAAPVIVANLIVAAAAIYATIRRVPEASPGTVADG